jgi:hypothetical protein
MSDGKRWSRVAACLAGAGWALAAAGAAAQTGPDELLKSPKFKAAYLAALGPKAKDKWLATLSNSALVDTKTVAGESYQVATPCKPHDCADNNLLLLYSPARNVVYGHLYEKGKVTALGSPPPALGAEMQKMWTREFRQR